MNVSSSMKRDVLLAKRILAIRVDKVAILVKQEMERNGTRREYSYQLLCEQYYTAQYTCLLVCFLNFEQKLSSDTMVVLSNNLQELSGFTVGGVEWVWS